MSGLVSLIKNENMKVYRRPRTWVMAALLLVFVLAAAIIMQIFNPEYSETEWRGQLKSDIADLQEQREKAEHPSPMSQQQIQEKQYYLEHDINPTEKNNWDVFASSVLISSFISLFVVIVASDIVASEFTWGTIKMLMVRPHKRSSILLSKFIVVLIFGVLMFVELFVASWFIGGIMFGFGPIDFTNVSFSNGEVIKETPGLMALKTYGLQMISLLVVISIAFMISTIFRSSALAIGIGIFVLFSGEILGGLLSMVDWGKYVLFPNLLLEQYITGAPPLIEGMTLTFSLIVDAIYFAIFLVLTWWIFNKRDIAA